MAIGGATKYIHRLDQKPGHTADAKLRAGFMLMPEKGASSEMYKQTRDPAISPVKRINLGCAFE